jgi:hypothetical protein
MYSYPNLIPLPAETVERMAAKVGRYRRLQRPHGPRQRQPCGRALAERYLHRPRER